MARQNEAAEIDVFELTTFPDEQSLFTALFPDASDANHVIKIIHPFYNSRRLVAQDAAFTVHTEPQRPLENYAGKKFAEGKLDIKTLYSWVIPGHCKTDIIKQLSGLGITQDLISGPRRCRKEYLGDRSLMVGFMSRHARHGVEKPKSAGLT